MMRMPLRGLLLTLLLAVSPAAMASPEAQPDAVFTRALERLSATVGFSCHFRQEVNFAEGGKKVYTGTLAVRRPGLFRWQYLTPYEQLYVSEGDVIWHYEADLMQAEKMKSLDAVDPAAMKLLDGRVGVKDIQLLATDKDKGGNISYRVRIGDGPELSLAFTSDGNLYWLESEDMLANRNRMILLDVDRMLPEEKLFHFVPPEGVDVVDLSGSGIVIPLHQTNLDGE